MGGDESNFDGSGFDESNPYDDSTDLFLIGDFQALIKWAENAEISEGHNAINNVGV